MDGGCRWAKEHLVGAACGKVRFAGQRQSGTPALAKSLRGQDNDSRSGENGLPEGMDEAPASALRRFWPDNSRSRVWPGDPPAPTCYWHPEQSLMSLLPLAHHAGEDKGSSLGGMHSNCSISLCASCSIW